MHEPWIRTLPPKQKSTEKKYSKLIKNDRGSYESWELLYHCYYSEEFHDSSLLANRKPSRLHPAEVPLVPQVPLESIPSHELKIYLGDVSARSCTPLPVIAQDLVAKFLSRVHAFTAFGLQSEAFAYSHERNGTIKYLLLLPQENAVDSVHSRRLCSSKHNPNDVTFADFMKEMQKYEPQRFGAPVQRCWLLTHPRDTPLLSLREIYKLYTMVCHNRKFFAIVFSPKQEGLKAICVQLTTDGFSAIARYEQRAQKQGDDDEARIKQKVIEFMTSADVDFYTQRPFTVADLPCYVVDMRGDEVIQQLTDFVDSRKADKTWA